MAAAAHCTHDALHSAAHSTTCERGAWTRHRIEAFAHRLDCVFHQSSFVAFAHTRTVWLDAMLSALSIAADSPLLSLHITILDDGLAPLGSVSPHSFVTLAGSPVPTLPALLRLLVPCPERRLAIQLESEEMHAAARRARGATHALAAAAEWQSAVQSYTSLVGLMPVRVRLVCGLQR